MAYIQDNLLSGNRLSGASIGTAISPGWGSLIGYGVGAASDVINNNYGGNVSDWLSDTTAKSLGWKKANSFGDFAAGIFDPGGLIFGTGKKPKEKSPPK